MSVRMKLFFEHHEGGLLSKYLRNAFLCTALIRMFSTHLSQDFRMIRYLLATLACLIIRIYWRSRNLHIVSIRL